MTRAMSGLLLLMGGVLAQPTLPYKALHQKLYPLVRDTSRREWLSRLRQEMETLRHLEWNDRFFREIVQLYLNQSDTLSILLHKLQKYVKVDSAALAALFKGCADRTAEPAVLIAAYEQLQKKAQGDTSHTGYLIRQGAALARSVVEAWITADEHPPLSLLIEAALKGYLRALLAAYTFFGFDESPESWQEKMRLIEAIGLLEYYAYGESANTFRAWKRGLLSTQN
ncbi:MAG: hypothetical protein N2253_03740 [Bacteroidia bacterium]|nr:hypothetical protein [Bacteroidia bacterium]MCX7763992.1 hypothetical protein [Bacteroidia bacterium]MDW8056876.1 hypothetical protein [Bacteroidia bacterium]